MKQRFLQTILFIVSSVIQVQIVDAKEYTIPAEDPKHCVKGMQVPCAITSGDRPRMFLWNKHRFELDRNIVMQTQSPGKWDLYKGLMVLESQGDQTIHTPFADILVGRSKLMIHVLENKVRVLSLDGEGVRVRSKGDPDEHFLVPGFQNWYGGVKDGQGESGVVSVIHFESYAIDRSTFFLNHELGFISELKREAAIVKWAARKASEIHRELVERKMASLEEIHQEQVLKKKRNNQFNEYLRRLFLQKVNYDY